MIKTVEKVLCTLINNGQYDTILKMICERKMGMETRLKRIVLLCLSCILMVLLLSGCSNSEGDATVKTNTSGDSSNVSAVETNRSAEEIANALKDAGMPIGNIVVYNEKTDPNSLLGRPNEYTSKANFADSTVEQTDPQNPVGGSIEVFGNSKDAQARYDYVCDVTSQMPLSQYIYLHGNVLLRIDSQVLPEDAARYQSAFNQIMTEG